MRFAPLGLFVALGVLATAAPAQAQVPFTNINDPFFAYYSFYLPRQQAQALQPGPEATINTIAANRQAYASTNRNEMFDPTGGGDSFDSGGEFNPNAGARRRTISGGPSRNGGNLNGLGPVGYFNTSATRQYYPTLRAGRGRNANVSVIRGRGYGGGSGASGSGLGLPGPR